MRKILTPVAIPAVLAAILALAAFSVMPTWMR